MWLIGLLLMLVSCAQKVVSVEEYEARNPYPGQTQQVHYSSMGSIMPSEGFVSLYSDTKARRVGDVIYVLLVESLNAVESVANQTSRSATFKEGVASLFGISKDVLDQLSAQGGGQMSTKGSGKFQQSAVISTRMAGRVMKVYPNGSMLIEAKKNFYWNNVSREMVLRGVVRGEDIDATNTVSSDKIANLEVIVEGRGFTVDGGNPGWLARLLAKVLPF
ncbi:flagellar basal body L-ring protein FlgH [Thermocrinis albus]|nr:flagellar basal body L-ring protein FlgH [Thermocrinis albus]